MVNELEIEAVTGREILDSLHNWLMYQLVESVSSNTISG